MPEHTAPQPSYVPPNDLSRGAPSSPIEHAFPQQPEFQFALRPVPNNTLSMAAPIPIDPALVPLPGGADPDVRHGPTIANAIGLKRAEKVGGSRRKGKERADPKGKKRQRASSGSDNDSEPVAKRGRPQGSANYSKENLVKMFDIIEDVLPVGQKGWKEVERRYNRSAKQRGWAERPPKALENKFKQYLRQKKPTGSGSCPPEVKRAHEIEELINQRVGTRELSDSEFDDPSDAGSSDEDADGVERTAIARRAPTPPLPRKSRVRGADLATKIASALDPEAQKDRDEARARRSFENTQILTMSQQLRDAHATTENLRTENNILRGRVHDLERELEREKLRREMMAIADDRRGRSRSRRRCSRSPRRYRAPGHRSHKREPGIDRVNSKIRYPSTDKYYDDEEENCNPFRLDRPWDHLESPHYSISRMARPISRRRTPSAGPSRRPMSRRRTPTPGPSRRPMSRRRTPTPGPSRLPALPPSPSPPPARIPIPDAVETRAATSAITGDAVELVVTPRHGPAVTFIVSPTKPSNAPNRN